MFSLLIENLNDRYIEDETDTCEYIDDDSMKVMMMMMRNL